MQAKVVKRLASSESRRDSAQRIVALTLLSAIKKTLTWLKDLTCLVGIHREATGTDSSSSCIRHSKRVFSCERIKNQDGKAR